MVGGNRIEKSSSRKITDLRRNRICSQKEKNGIPGIDTGNAKTIRHIDKGLREKSLLKECSLEKIIIRKDRGKEKEVFGTDMGQST